MPYCPRCGTKVDEVTAFCPNCGAALKVGQAPQPAGERREARERARARRRAEREEKEEREEEKEEEKEERREEKHEKKEKREPSIVASLAGGLILFFLGLAFYLVVTGYVPTELAWTMFYFVFSIVIVGLVAYGFRVAGKRHPPT